MPTAAPRFDDFLTLARLYARFDAIAEGRAQGDSTAAHQAVLDRLHDNQSFAEASGWSGFVLARLGGSGRLVLWGIDPAGRQDVVGDWVPGVRRGSDPAAVHAVESPPGSDNARSRNQHIYDELKPARRRSLPAASPVLDIGVFERVATRMATIDVRSRTTTSTTSTTAPIAPVGSGSMVLVNDVEAPDESRWSDDGGK